jgi:hypothetical protein
MTNPIKTRRRLSFSNDITRQSTVVTVVIIGGAQNLFPMPGTLGLMENVFKVIEYNPVVPRGNGNCVLPYFSETSPQRPFKQ